MKLDQQSIWSAVIAGLVLIVIVGLIAYFDLQNFFATFLDALFLVEAKYVVLSLLVLLLGSIIGAYLTYRRLDAERATNHQLTQQITILREADESKTDDFGIVEIHDAAKDTIELSLGQTKSKYAWHGYS